MMKTYGKENSDHLLVLALASGLTVPRAAERAGLGTSTAYRRLEDKVFRQQVAKARDEMLERAVGRLADAACFAVTKLVQLLNCGVPSIELGAARSILELGPRLREEAELASRITQLEGRK